MLERSLEVSIMNEGMNILLLVSDTFRRDHLGCYGNREIKTPRLDWLASRSIVFNRCYTCSFPTVPCRADLFTGRWTFTYHGWQPLPLEEKVLAQILSENGYNTMGVADTPFLVKDGFHYDRGFKDFIWVRGQGPERRDINYERRYECDYCAPSTMITAAKWLQRHYKEKFFLYVDTWDPHEPWDPPAWFVEYYDPGYDGRIVGPCYWLYKERGLSDEDLRVAHNCYCGEITMVDKWIGYMLDQLDALNLMEKTIIVFTTDHGFYFGEHGQFGKAMLTPWPLKPGQTGEVHRSPLYEEISHIPLFVHIPGYKPKRLDSLVSLPDLMPTLLDLVGVDIPKEVQARSMVPLIEGEDDGRDFTVTSFPLKEPGSITRIVTGAQRKVMQYLPITVTSEDWALIYSTGDEPAELYRLPSDPNQERNVIDDHFDVAVDLHRKLLGFLSEANTDPRHIEPRRKISKN